jgi:hypothetical protein
MVSAEVSDKMEERCVINVLVGKCSQVADTQGRLAVKQGDNTV